MDKVWSKSMESGVSFIILLINIMSSNHQSYNELGMFIANKLEIEDLNENILGLFIFVTYIKLWFDNFNGFYENINILKEININIEYYPLDFVFLEKFLILLLKKNQLEVVYGLMKDSPNLQEQFKPIYYATTSLLKDERQEEYLRMGPELKGTVNEILQKVEEFRVQYT